MFKVNTVSPRRSSRTPVTLTHHDAIERAARDYSNLLLLYVMIDFAELKIVSLLGANIILALKMDSWEAFYGIQSTLLRLVLKGL